MAEEKKQSLPVGHPQAGYLPPEPNDGYGTGTLPAAEQDALDQAKKEYEEQAKAVADNEDKVAKAESGAEAEAEPKPTAKASSSS